MAWLHIKWVFDQLRCISMTGRVWILIDRRIPASSFKALFYVKHPRLPHSSIVASVQPRMSNKKWSRSSNYSRPSLSIEPPIIVLCHPMVLVLEHYYVLWSPKEKEEIKRQKVVENKQLFFSTVFIAERKDLQPGHSWLLTDRLQQLLMRDISRFLENTLQWSRFCFQLR